MKRCLLLAVILLCGVPLFAQNNGAILPGLPPQFFTIAGVPASGAKLCFTASGTSNRLDVFSDAALTSALPEPVTLSAAGYPQTSGNAPTAIFIQSKSYRVTLYLSGTGNTCNGVTVGAQVWQQDNVYDFAMVATSLNGVQFCPAGTSADVRILAGYANLPAQGGVLDCRNLTGAQTIAAGFTLGSTTKPVQLLLGAATFTNNGSIIVAGSSAIIGSGTGTTIILSASASAPANESIRMQGDGSSISNLRIEGVGQTAGASVDGKRGIWLGCGTNQTVLCIVNEVTVDSVEVDSFASGNGIAGDCHACKIINSHVHHNSDSNLFFQPASTENLVSGNELDHSRYSGIDINGSLNKVTNNSIHDNGGGVLDLNSWNGVLIAYANNSLTTPLNANGNIVQGNTIANNQGCGVLVQGLASTAGVVNTPYGNQIIGNQTSGHTTLTGAPSGLKHNQWFGGYCLEGGNETLVQGNTSNGDAFGVVVSSTSATNSTGATIVENHVFNTAIIVAISATTSGVSYYFPASSRLDGVGGSPANDVILSGNQANNPTGNDCYRWALDTATTANNYGRWTIRDNKAKSCNGWGFNNNDPNQFASYTFVGNDVLNATLGKAQNFVALGLTANSTTPSVSNVNGGTVTTQNTTSTAITYLNGGISGQTVKIVFGDSVTTVAFTNATGSVMHGYGNANFHAQNGDIADCQLVNLTWWCTAQHLTKTGMPQPVVQLTSKATAITQNSELTGVITTFNTAMGTSGSATAVASFNFNNDVLGANDTVFVTVTGGPNPGFYKANCSNNGAGQCVMFLTHLDPVNSASDAVVLQYNIVKNFIFLPTLPVWWRRRKKRSPGQRI